MLMPIHSTAGPLKPGENGSPGVSSVGVEICVRIDELRFVSKTFSVSEFVVDTLFEMLASGAIGSSVPDSGAGFVPDSANLTLCVKSE